MGKAKSVWERPLVRYAGTTVLAFCILGIYALVALNLKVFNPIAKAASDYSFEDFYYQILGSASAADTSRVVTIVDMTELTSRRDIAAVMEEIESLRPRVLGVDITFEVPKEDVEGDSLLAATAQQCRNAVFAYKLIDRTDEAVHSYFMPCDSVAEGFVNMPRQLYGGMKRRLSIGRLHQGQLYPSLIKLVADRYAGEEVVPLADEELPINFTPIHFRVIPYDAVSEHPEWIEDRIVLFGAMKEENDMHYTPQGKMAGMELMAYGVETMLRQNQLRTVPGWLTAVLSFVLVLVVVVLRSLYIAFAGRRHPLLRMVLQTELAIGLVVFIMIAVIVWVAFILFSQYNISMNMAYAIAAIAMIFNASDFYKTITDYFTKKQS